MDNYYHERAEDIDPIWFRANTNFDTPAILHLDLLQEDLLRLSRGESITNRVFDFPSNRYSDTEIRHDPTEVVIIEGLFAALLAKSLPAELKYYIVHVQTDDYYDLLNRRSIRDMQERGRANKAEVLKYERKYVGEGFLKYTAKNATGSDHYVENNALPTGVTKNRALEVEAQSIVNAFQTRLATPIIRNTPKTIQEHVLNSHIKATTMPDRAPCFTGNTYKSFSGVFGEQKGLYSMTPGTKRKHKACVINDDNPFKALRRSPRFK